MRTPTLRWTARTGLTLATAGLLLVAVPIGARGDAEFPAGLVPGTPLPEEELALYEGKGVRESMFEGSDYEGYDTEVPYYQRTEARVEAAMSAARAREGRASFTRSEGARGASGADVRPALPTSVGRSVDNRMDAAIDRAIAAEMRTHWSIWPTGPSRR